MYPIARLYIGGRASDYFAVFYYRLACGNIAACELVTLRYFAVLEGNGNVVLFVYNESFHGIKLPFAKQYSQ